jgi:hypothetical protein
MYTHRKLTLDSDGDCSQNAEAVDDYVSLTLMEAQAGDCQGCPPGANWFPKIVSNIPRENNSSESSKREDQLTPLAGLLIIMRYNIFCGARRQSKDLFRTTRECNVACFILYFKAQRAPPTNVCGRPSGSPSWLFLMSADLSVSMPTMEDF